MPSYTTTTTCQKCGAQYAYDETVVPTDETIEMLAACWRAQRPVPVSERLPESPSVVLCFAYGEWRSADFNDGKFASDGEYLHQITHWLPLPPAPEQLLFAKKIVLADMPEAKGNWTLTPLPKQE